MNDKTHQLPPNIKNKNTLHSLYIYTEKHKAVKLSPSQIPNKTTTNRDDCMITCAFLTIRGTKAFVNQLGKSTANVPFKELQQTQQS